MSQNVHAKGSSMFLYTVVSILSAYANTHIKYTIKQIIRENVPNANARILALLGAVLVCLNLANIKLLLRTDKRE